MNIFARFAKAWCRPGGPEFRTPNLDLAAILLCQGCGFLKVDRTDPRHCQFVFHESFELQELVQRFTLRCVIMVAVSRFLEAQKTLRGELARQRA